MPEGRNFLTAAGIIVVLLGTSVFSSSSAPAADAPPFSPRSEPRSAAGTWQLGAADSEPSMANGILAAVSCTGTECLAVGGYTNLETDGVPLVDRLTPAGPAPLPLATDSTQLSLEDVSCSPGGTCLAIGNSTAARPFAFGGSTSGLAPVPMPAPPAGVKEYTVRAVDCWDGGCEVVGYGRAGGRTVPFAMSWVGGAWQVQDVPNPAPSSDVIFLEAVDCPDASTCVVTGANRTGNAIAEVLQAGAWTVTPVPAGRTNLLSVSCVSASWCMAVGGEFNDTAAAVVWDGASWSLVGGLPDLQQVDSVACSAVNDCTVVGQPVARGNDVNTSVLLRHTGTGWAFERAPLPSPYPRISDVTCSAASCTAVGNYAIPGLYGTNPISSFAVVRAGGGWSPLPTSRLPGHFDSSLVDVDCPKATQCMAVGRDATPDGTVSYSQRYQGGRWSFQPLPGPAGANISGVSCPSVRRCYSVGGVHNGVNSRAVVVGWNGTKWRQVKLKLSGISFSYLSSVACSSKRFCVAVGGAIFKHAGNFPTQPLSLVMTGRRWKVVKPVMTHHQGYVFHGISCMGESRTCVGVGDDGLGGGFSQVFNGKVWKSVPLRLPRQFTKASLDDVSCTRVRCESVGFVASGGHSKYLVERYQQGRWFASTFSIRSSPSRTASISCAKGCVVVNGQSAAHLRKHLSFETVPGEVRLVAVSCAAPGGRCVAVGGTGDETGKGGKPVAYTRHGPV